MIHKKKEKEKECVRAYFNRRQKGLSHFSLWYPGDSRGHSRSSTRYPRDSRRLSHVSFWYLGRRKESVLLASGTLKPGEVLVISAPGPRGLAGTVISASGTLVTREASVISPSRTLETVVQNDSDTRVNDGVTMTRTRTPTNYY